MRALLPAALLLLTALSAGCSDGAPPADASLAEAVPAPAPAVWETSTYTGDFVTTNPVNPGGITGDIDEFPMPELVAEAWFNITVTGDLPGDVDVRYNEPGCDQLSCIEDRPVRGGTLATRFEEPNAGQWEVLFFAPEGAQRGTYTLDVTIRMEAPASGPRTSTD
jgi:hypothetical protein